MRTRLICTQTTWVLDVVQSLYGVMPELSDFEKEVTPTLGFRKLRLNVKEIPEYYLFSMVSLTEDQVQPLLTLPNTSPPG